MIDFIHLHNHTHYSLLDAACTPEQLIKAAKADNQKAIAITDHGVMFGCIEFYKIAKKHGIKPIIGFEAYIANGSRFEKISGKVKDKKVRNYFHLVLLAKDWTGYKNLVKLCTLGHTEGFYYKPRIDRELLEKYHEGIIATSACIAGVVNAHLVRNNLDEAYETAKYYKDLFGDDFYIELQNHDLPEDKIILKRAPKIASDLGIKIIATNDIHYEKKEHAIAHNVLLNIRDVTAASSGTIDIKNLRYRTPEMYFKTQAEMNALFSEFPEALQNTIEIGEKCNFELKETLYMPEFKIPSISKSKNLDDYLEELTESGLNKRFKEITPEIRQRTDYELNVIKSMGFSGYFLIVQDFIKEAKVLGVSVGPGRGSAAGSLVAYALAITNVNPLPYDLLFERFLNPERVSMPDIDIDFCDEKREVIINYVKEKYGEKSVAQIITFGKLSTKAVLKDVGRVLGVPHQHINEINSKIPTEMGKVKPLAEALELPELKEFKESKDPKIKELIQYALLLEGKLRNAGTHAAGVVIAPDDIMEFVPLYQPSRSKGEGTEIVTQYSGTELETAGLLKMDFLGLKTLSIIDNTLEMIYKKEGVNINLDEIDFEDPLTFELLSNGNTTAVFQFESKGMQEYLRQLKPRNLEEITAMNALYRPGPMENIPDYIDRKNGKKNIQYLHPIMEKSLNKTYGIIVYQEQVMQLAQDIAGYTLGGADLLRRAIGKKKLDVMAAQKPIFVQGAKKNGVEEKISSEIWDLIEKFANYGFNKSHSLAYSYLAFQTAWLKAHYPAEFLAANMTSELNDQDKIVQLIDEAKKFDIKILHPDINNSMAKFTVLDNNIIFGLAGIKNVGIAAVESIIKVRDNKPFTSFFDFISRVDTKLINKRTLEALVCSGAFDSLHSGYRSQLFASIETAMDYARACNNNQQTNMSSLFGETQHSVLSEPSLPDIPEWDEQTRLEQEKTYMNFYVSGHPLDRYKHYIQSFATLSMGDTKNKLVGEKVRVCGIISEVRKRLDKHNNTLAFIMLEDFTGKAECVFWSDAYSKFGHLINKDKIVLIGGKSECSGDDLKIYVDELIPIEETINKLSKGLRITINIDDISEDNIDELKKICNSPASKTMVMFHLYSKSNKSFCKRYAAYNVQISLNENSIDSIADIFGKQNIKVLTNV